MTRFTNIALKRTYVQAGFNYREPEEDSNEAGPSYSQEDTKMAEAPKEDGNEPLAPKRKRSRKKSKKNPDVNGDAVASGESIGQDGPADSAASGSREASTAAVKANDTKASKGKKKLKQKGLKGKDARKAASEQRRLRRQDERMADTTCFACRERGHAARFCPKAIASDALEGEGGQKKLGRQAVGICYRCGSRKHNLSRCQKPIDPENPLPFSSCFVCSKQGHLASQCPENRAKGVYPNGGCCKLCQETTHLAKDCPMRKPEVIASKTLIGTGAEAGADEDDFHTFRRKTLEITKEEKADDRRRKQQTVKVGAHSGVVKAFGRPLQTAHKVVNF